LANVDIDSLGTVIGEWPRLNGIEKICKELSDAFSRGYIRQQSYYSVVRSKLEEFTCQCETLTTLTQKQPGMTEDPMNGSLDHFTTDISNSDDRSLRVMELKTSLRDLYAALASITESKLTLLRTTQDIFDHCQTYIVCLAEDNGVLNALAKYQAATSSSTHSLLHHRLFVADEGHELFQVIRQLWGRLALSGSTNEELTDKDLVRVVSRPSLSLQTTRLA